MSFQLLDHTADIAIEATGPTMESVFAAVANGMAAAMCDDIPDADGAQVTVTASGESPTAALFEYLNEVILQRDIQQVLFTDNEVTIDQSGSQVTVKGTARGVSLDKINAREIKAVTYSEMELTDQNGTWYAHVVFDV